jgi:hypothetical protein
MHWRAAADQPVPAIEPANPANPANPAQPADVAPIARAAKVAVPSAFFDMARRLTTAPSPRQAVPAQAAKATPPSAFSTVAWRPTKARIERRVARAKVDKTAKIRRIETGARQAATAADLAKVGATFVRGRTSAVRARLIGSPSADAAHW